MRLSSQLRQHSQQPKSRLEALLSEDRKDKSRAFSPHASRLNFHKQERSTSYHFSGPQIPQNKMVHMQNERYHNLSANFNDKKQQQSGAKLQQDSNLTYIKQIDSLAHKKRMRYYFKRQKEACQQQYNIGVFTGTGIEQGKEASRKVSEELPQVVSQERQQRSELDVEQMHFQMVRAQQKYKNIINQ